MACKLRPLLGDVVAILPRFTTPFLLLQRTQDVQTSLANSWLANVADAGHAQRDHGGEAGADGCPDQKSGGATSDPRYGQLAERGAKAP